MNNPRSINRHVSVVRRGAQSLKPDQTGSPELWYEAKIQTVWTSHASPFITGTRCSRRDRISRIPERSIGFYARTAGGEERPAETSSGVPQKAAGVKRPRRCLFLLLRIFLSSPDPHSGIRTPGAAADLLCQRCSPGGAHVYPGLDCGPLPCCSRVSTACNTSLACSGAEDPVQAWTVLPGSTPGRDALSDAASDPRPASPASPARPAAAGLAGRGGPGSKEGDQDPVLPRPAGGDPGADVRPAVGGSDERLPSRAAAGSAGPREPDLPGPRGPPDRQQDPPPGQPAQRVPLGLQAVLRPGPVPPLRPRGLLPVSRLPAGSVRRGEPPLPQHASLCPLCGPEEGRVLRGGPPLLHGDLRVRGRGLHLCAAAAEGERRPDQQPESGETAVQARTAWFCRQDRLKEQDLVLLSIPLVSR